MIGEEHEPILSHEINEQEEGLSLSLALDRVDKDHAIQSLEQVLKKLKSVD